MSTVAFDVAAVRARFSAIQRSTAFFDGPGGTQTPDSVIDAVASYLREANANLGGPFETSLRSDQRTTRRRASSAPHRRRWASGRT
jgi:selenocysteine lyase/cysteine desulfurase